MSLFLTIKLAPQSIGVIVGETLANITLMSAVSFFAKFTASLPKKTLVRSLKCCGVRPSKPLAAFKNEQIVNLVAFSFIFKKSCYRLNEGLLSCKSLLSVECL